MKPNFSPFTKTKEWCSWTVIYLGSPKNHIEMSWELERESCIVHKKLHVCQNTGINSGMAFLTENVINLHGFAEQYGSNISQET